MLLTTQAILIIFSHLLFHDLLQCAQGQHLSLLQAHVLAVPLLQRALRTLSATADRLGRVARVGAGWVGVVAAHTGAGNMGVVRDGRVM